MKLIMENWKKFVDEQEEYKFDPSNMEKMASDAARSRSELDNKVAELGDAIAQDPDRFLDGAQSIEDVESRIEAVAKEIYKIPGLSVEDFNTVYAKLRDHFGFDLDDADPDEFPLQEEQVLKFINEEIDRMISEGLLEEGFKDVLRKAGMIGALSAAALGAFGGAAQAKPFSQDRTLPQNAQEVGLSKYDSQHKVHLEKKIDQQIVNAIKKLPGRKDQLMKLDNGKKASEGNPAPLLLGKMAEQVEEALPQFVQSDEEIYKVAEKVVGKTKELKPKLSKTTSAKMENIKLRLARDLNALSGALSGITDEDPSEAQDNLFKSMKRAEKAGEISSKQREAAFKAYKDFLDGKTKNLSGVQKALGL